MRLKALYYEPDTQIGGLPSLCADAQQGSNALL